MDNRGFYIAAAIFLAAVGLFYLFDARKSTPSTASSPRPAAVVNLDAASVSEIDIRASGKLLTVSKSGSDWRYAVCPADHSGCPSSPADAILSIRLLQAILQLTPTKTIFGAPEGLPAYGLVTATGGEIDLKTQAGRSVVILVGGHAPDNASVYLRLSDSNDIQAVPASAIQGPILGVVDSPPVPQPSPSPAAAASPSASPTATPIGPVGPSP
jgi:hypothetical protein